MEPIRLIHDKRELRGTCYFEFQPGEYRDRCWNDGSVFLHEEVFGLIEPIFDRHVPSYDHYAFMNIERQTWEQIIHGLRAITTAAKSARSVRELRDSVGFFFTTTEKIFNSDFRSNADALAGMADELASWLAERLKEHEIVSLLGM